MSGPTRDAYFPQSDVRPVYLEGSGVALQLTTQTQTVYAAQPNPTGAGNSGQLAVGALHELLVLIAIVSITGGGNLTFFVETLDNYGNWFALYTGTAQSAAIDLAVSLGMGAVNNQSIGNTVRVRWTAGGTVSASAVDVTVYGK